MLQSRLFLEPTDSYFLFGPRGVGKTTLLTQLHPEAISINLLKVDVHRAYLARPELLRETVLATSRHAPIVIDEVQRLPSLLHVVHELMDTHPHLKFILTGSSSRKLKREGVDLLGGRALKKSLHPFLAYELGENFHLAQALSHGMLPLIQQKTDKMASLQAYIALYLQEEVKAEGLVRHLDQFARFLEAISFSHGAQLNLVNIAKECEVKRNTVENYLDILYDLLLAFKIPVFQKRAQRELVTREKLYLFDAGVYHALRPKGLLDSQSEIAGMALEGLVAQHLRAFCDYSQTQNQLYFWRTRAGLEVDFVIYGETEFLAIEVKHSKMVSQKDCRSLQTFLQDYPEARGLILYRGTEKRLLAKNILAIPIETFLRQIKPDTPLTHASV